MQVAEWFVSLPQTSRADSGLLSFVHCPCTGPNCSVMDTREEFWGQTLLFAHRKREDAARLKRYEEEKKQAKTRKRYY